jgi:RNA polymerase sigma-70 factor (sigma-E family)
MSRACPDPLNRRTATVTWTASQTTTTDAAMTVLSHQPLHRKTATRFTHFRCERHRRGVTFAEFAAARLPSLLRYAVALTGDRDLAQDVVQEALAKAQVNWRKVQRADSPDAYLRRIVLNEYLSWRRRWAVRNIQAAGEHMVDLLDGRTATLDHADAVVEGDELWSRLATLPRKQRAVLVLRYYEQLDDKEIASLLDCAPVTVRSNASKALKTLRLDSDRNQDLCRETSDV